MCVHHVCVCQTLAQEYDLYVRKKRSMHGAVSSTDRGKKTQRERERDGCERCILPFAAVAKKDAQLNFVPSCMLLNCQQLFSIQFGLLD